MRDTRAFCADERGCFLMNVDALIPLLGGAYCTYMGFRGVPAGTAKQAEWERWYARWGRFMKIGGPLLTLFGAARLLLG